MHLINDVNGTLTKHLLKKNILHFKQTMTCHFLKKYIAPGKVVLMFDHLSPNAFSLFKLQYICNDDTLLL